MHLHQVKSIWQQKWRKKMKDNRAKVICGCGKKISQKELNKALINALLKITIDHETRIKKLEELE